MTDLKNEKTIKIAGAGISGITAAIALAKAGINVEIYERTNSIGTRFHGDFQGLENWTQEEDILNFLKKIGLEINFDYQTFNKITIWGPNNFLEGFTVPRSPFYMVKRGPFKGSLDSGLKKQLENNKNIKIFYNHLVKDFSKIDIIATGPVMNDKNVDAFAAGYTFNTNIPNGVILIFDDELAKDGYSYFLVSNGYGVIATCIFNNFKRLIEYREKTLKACKEKVNFIMRNVNKFTGTGNLFLGKKTFRKKLFIGEAGGYQDYLWGFGMRIAATTGYLAAKSILNRENYYQLIEKGVLPRMMTSIFNRFWFTMLGNSSYKLFIKSFQSTNNPYKALTDLYNPNLIKKIIYPLAYLYYRKHLKDPRQIVI